MNAESDDEADETREVVEPTPRAGHRAPRRAGRHARVMRTSLTPRGVSCIRGVCALAAAMLAGESPAPPR